jgi:hypothetical protein
VIWLKDNQENRGVKLISIIGARSFSLSPSQSTMSILLLWHAQSFRYRKLRAGAAQIDRAVCVGKREGYYIVTTVEPVPSRPALLLHHVCY